MNKKSLLHNKSLFMCMVVLIGMTVMTKACEYQLDENHFDLSSLEISASGTAYKTSYTYGTTTYNLAFNFCGYTPNTSKCNGKQDFATLTYTSTCSSITGSSLSSTTYNYYDSGNHTKGIVLTYPNGDVCPHSTSENYQFSVAVVCDQDRKSDVRIEIDTNSITTPCSPKAIVYSDKGCAVLKINPLFEWLESMKFAVGPLAGILGVFLMICSLYYYKTTCYMIGVCSLPVIIVGILYGACIPTSSATWIVTIPVVLSILLGLGFGYYSMKYTVLAKILAGFFFGFVIESFLYLYFFFRFEDFIVATTVFWIMLGAIVLIGSLIGAFFFPMSFIVNTSFVGSYLFFRCIGTFAGGFTNEFAIAREREENRYDQIAWQNYVYIGLTLLMGGIATVIQYKINNLKYYDKSDNEKKGFSQI